ncbi:MAG: TonB-dependent receptor [Sphingomicrobium sp.]
MIKGPQSALYGRQTFSGAISYVTKKPSDKFEATARARIAERGEVDLLGTVSGPIIPGKVSAQIAGNYYNSPGYYRNTAPGDAGNGRRLGSEKTTAISGILRITPTAALDISLRGSYSDNDDGVDPTAFQRASVNNCFPNTAGVFRYYCGPVERRNVSLGLNTGSLPDFGGILRKTKRFAATAAYDFGGATLTLISGYNDSREQRQFDLDFLPLNTGGGTRNVDDTTNIKSFSQEARVASDGSGRFNWILGGYYYHENRDTLRLTYSTNALQNNGRIRTLNLAGFGLVRYRFTDRLSASAEVRYAEENLNLVGGNAKFDIRATYKSTNPRFTVDYKLTPNVLLYASAARGNKPGGFNPDLRLPTAVRSYGEESSWNYEAGIKSDLFDRKLRLNVAAYYIDWKNQQLTQSIIIPACVVGQPVNPAIPCATGTAQSTSYILNVGALHVKGIETEAVAAVTSWLRLNGTFSYNDAKFVRGTDSEVGTLTGNPSLVGKHTPNAPRFQYSIGATVQAPAFAGYEFVANLDYGYRSRKFDQVGNFAWAPGRGVGNLRFGLESPSYSATLFVRNLFDNKSVTTVTRYSDFSTATLLRGFAAGLPAGRQVGLTLQAKFR